MFKWLLGKTGARAEHSVVAPQVDGAAQAASGKTSPKAAITKRLPVVAAKVAPGKVSAAKAKPAVAKVKLPAICLDTTRFAEQNAVGPWTFCVPDAAIACAYAIARSGALLESHEGKTLPHVDCDKIQCGCHYKLALDRRKESRRVGEVRRVDVRFEPAKDERRKKGRRKLDGWDRARP
jgi:hypothetical protein